MMRAGGDASFVISRDEIHGLFSGGVLNDTDRDAVTFTARVDAAVAGWPGWRSCARRATTRTATP